MTQKQSEIGNSVIVVSRSQWIQVRFPGYIRMVFADVTYQCVSEGEPLFSIYSPELVALRQEYLLGRQNQKAISAGNIDGFKPPKACGSSFPH